MRTVIRHPNGVMVGNKLFLRDDYYATEHVSVREWLALGVLLFGLLVWAGGTIGALVWLVSEVLHRWH